MSQFQHLLRRLDQESSWSEMDMAPGAYSREPTMYDVSDELGLDVQHFCIQVKRLTGFDLTPHALSHVQDVYDHFHEVKKYDGCDGPKAYFDAANFVLVKHSSFFRDPHFWSDLKTNYLDTLVKNKQTVMCWSCGCREGEEPFSLAYLFKHFYPQTDVSIIATDLDLNAINAATKAIWRIDDIRAQVRYPFQVTFDNEFNPELVEASLEVIDYQQHDALMPPPRENLDLILCRYLAIHLSEEARDKLLENLTKSLRKGGMLVIDKIFTSDEYSKYNLVPVDHGFLKE